MKPMRSALILCLAVACLSVAGFAQGSSGTTASTPPTGQPAEHSSAELAKKLADPICRHQMSKTEAHTNMNEKQAMNRRGTSPSERLGPLMTMGCATDSIGA